MNTACFHGRVGSSSSGLKLVPSSSTGCGNPQRSASAGKRSTDSTSRNDVPGLRPGTATINGIRAFLEKTQFMPEPTMFTQMIAMIAHEYHNRPIRESKTVEGIKQQAHLRVHEADGGIVSGDGVAGALFRKFSVATDAVGECQVRHLCEMVRWSWAWSEFIRMIEGVILFRRDIRCMRPAKSCGDEERFSIRGRGLHTVRPPGERRNHPTYFHPSPAARCHSVPADAESARRAGSWPRSSRGCRCPRTRVFELVSRVKDLADLDRAVSVLTKELGQENRVFQMRSGWRGVVEHPCCVRSPSAQERRA